MTYLEIDGIIEATGTFYATYRAKLLHTPEKILAGFAPAERKFVKRILDSGELKRWWLYFYPTPLAQELGVSREKIVSAINSLQSAGDIILGVSGVRHGYKLKKEPGDIKELTARLVEKFQTREQSDLARLRQVLALSAHRGCLTGYLTKYFGETLAGPCGHCDRCRGVPAKTIKRPKPRRVTNDEIAAVRKLVDEKHAALATPRQLARFLCGMASPAATRARLTRNNAFAMLADLPFAEVLVIAEAA
jgi:ATP-dependent DNA helicase RecQ